MKECGWEKVDHGLFLIEVKYIMEIVDGLWVLWCLNEWNERSVTLEEEILHAIKLVKERQDVGVVRDDPILMDLVGTEAHSKWFKMEDFKPEIIVVEQDARVPSKHIYIPVIQRTPVKYIRERKPL